MTPSQPADSDLIDRLIFNHIGSDGTPTNRGDFLTEDTLGRDDGVRGQMKA